MPTFDSSGRERVDADLTRVGGTAVDTDAGNAGAGTQRVVIATDQPAFSVTTDGLLVAQDSATAGQEGPLVQGAVTAAAPVYSASKTNPLSLTQQGALRVAVEGWGGITVVASAPADNASLANSPKVQALPILSDGGGTPHTYLARQVVAAMDSTGNGIQSVGLVGQFDDASTATVTEDQFAPVRISSRRALLVEGVASGTAVTVDTELPAAAALSDALANPTAPAVGAHQLLWDGTQWLRAPAPKIVPLLSSAARTTQQNVAVQTNTGHRGVSIALYVTAASGTGGLTLRIQETTPLGIAGGVTCTLLQATAAVTTTGYYVYRIYPGSEGATLVPTIGAQLSYGHCLPPNWRVVIAVGDASSYTYSVEASLLP